MLYCHKNVPRWELGLYRGSSLRGFTRLHGAAFLRIAEVLVALLAIKEWDINAANTNGWTALSWVAVGGHGCVVEILLRWRMSILTPRIQKWSNSTLVGCEGRARGGTNIGIGTREYKS